MSSTTKAETTTPKEKVVAPSPPSTAAVAASTSTTKTPAAPAAVVEPPRHDVDERVKIPSFSFLRKLARVLANSAQRRARKGQSAYQTSETVSIL
ncbi:hypothetical protein ACMFMG_002870 [Clarireedia jacksonii]